MSAPVIPEEAKCLDCNYALRGLIDFRCPECGRPFDPQRHLSMNLGRPLDAFARWAMRPMGPLPRLAMWGIVALGVVAPACLVPDRGLACLWLILWFAFFVVCWLRSAVRVAVVRRYRQPRVVLRVDDPLRRRVRIAFVTSVLIVLTRLPFLLAVLVSRPWLDRFAYHAWAEIPADSPLPTGPMMRGVVLVERVSVGGNGVTLDLYGGGIHYMPTEDGQSLRLVWWTWNPWNPW